MVLNSAAFLGFLALSAVIYYAVPQRMQNSVLLAASAVFYLWSAPAYAPLLLLSILVSYAAAKKIVGESRRGLWLGFGLAGTLLPLFFFKYLGFFSRIVSDLFGIVGLEVGMLELQLILPLGISFYTFQVVGYLLDVYHKKIEPEEDFVRYALFASFFPQIISGPIGRAKELLPQYRNPRALDWNGISLGLRRFLTGAFRKVVVADGLAILVNPIFNDPYAYSSGALLLAMLLYALQIYFDFAGYSDMAIGAARVLGIELRKNFDAPYLATDMGMFWKRWHISLTSWLQDYIFTPLVWSRWFDRLFFKKKMTEKMPAILPNLLLVFLISGLWHGASYNFLIWGAINGLYRVAGELITKRRGKKKKKKLSSGKTLLCRAKVFLLFGFSLVFFRAATLPDALYMFRLLAIEPIQPALVLREVTAIASNGISTSTLYYVLYFGVLLLSLAIAVLLDHRTDALLQKKQAAAASDPLGTFPEKQRWVLYWFFELSVLFFYLIALTGASGVTSFIYGGF